MTLVSSRNGLPVILFFRFPGILRGVPDVREKSEPRDLVYTVEQVAALLEAAWACEQRRHIHMFIMIMLSTNARVEAVLELDKE